MDDYLANFQNLQDISSDQGYNLIDFIMKPKFHCFVFPFIENGGYFGCLYLNLIFNHYMLIFESYI